MIRWQRNRCQTEEMVVVTQSPRVYAVKWNANWWKAGQIEYAATHYDTVKSVIDATQQSFEVFDARMG